MPSVSSASYGFPSPFSGALIASSVEVPGRRSHDSSALQSFWAYVSPKYFETVGAPLLAGRDFTSADRKGSMPVAIVNQKFAGTYFPGQNPLGKQFKSGLGSGELTTIVGITRDLPFFELTETPKIWHTNPCCRARDRQILTVRLRRNPDALERQLANIIRRLVPALPLQQFKTMALQRDASIAQQRMLALLSSIFAALALVLSTVGLYGLVSYSVARRTCEIGIRISVGASPLDLLSLFLRFFANISHLFSSV